MRRIAEEILLALSAVGEAPTKALRAATGLDRKQVDRGCVVLEARGLAYRVRKGRYRITVAGRTFVAEGNEIKPGPKGERKRHAVPGTFRERIWQTLRLMRKGTVPEILAMAATGQERDALCNARKYLAALERSGHVVRHRDRLPGTAPTSNGYVRWILVRNTGPCSPTLDNRPGRECVFDPNRNEVRSL